MLGLVSAYGKTKDEVIINLLEAIKDLQKEDAGNCLAGEWEYNIFPAKELVPMGTFLVFNEAGGLMGS